MTVLLVLAVIVAGFYALNYATATPRARAVPVSVRLAEARRIAAGEPAYVLSSYSLPAEPGSVEFR